ncbi:unnamed protein product [Trichobilharzia szidati]|nr:unnamed protein product [Trichobilharzia szidati]
MNDEEIKDFFMDPMVTAYIESFMEAHCSIFTCDEEVHPDHLARHKEYSEMMKHLLSDSKINYQQLKQSLNILLTNEKKSLNSISYIIACWNFKLFYQIMTLVNIDLQMEALYAIQQKNSSCHSKLLNCSMDHTTEINESEINIMLAEKSNQKDGVIKNMKKTIQNEFDQPNIVQDKINLTNDQPKSYFSIPSNSDADTITSIEVRSKRPSNSVLSTNWTLDHDKLNGIPANQQNISKLSKPTRDEIIAKQEFLRKQRDLLIEMRRKQREQLFPNQWKTFKTTDNQNVSDIIHDNSASVSVQDDEIMKRRRQLYEKLKVEVINKNSTGNIS